MPALREVVEKKGIWADKATVISRGTLTVYVNDLVKSVAEGKKLMVLKIFLDVLGRPKTLGSE